MRIAYTNLPLKENSQQLAAQKHCSVSSQGRSLKFLWYRYHPEGRNIFRSALTLLAIIALPSSLFRLLRQTINFFCFDYTALHCLLHRCLFFLCASQFLLSQETCFALSSLRCIAFCTDTLPLHSLREPIQFFVQASSIGCVLCSI